ncbi:hypothetical protein SAMN04488095_3534 [Jannaschia pohangensis]|uniref:Uncharacterized protein n=1 Tax=Jannaschia pohangensis TaxID=390807 RepID=A0A1I3TXS5_9RHOB|nr:hypothetical protein SAMN04488095_3534 [Jannaschia pohangensis]
MKPIIALLTAVTLLASGPASARSGGGVTLPHLTFPNDDSGSQVTTIIRSNRGR